ncbi:Ubiquitin carboxyl-terminal hydrolase 36 [Linnemannia gamsii]|uniref:Ubiquitin carboxyl-terminal hydrolase n=1 Tax=Linnemannia gamsii TaxID=64522 RepID=A0ABQ7JL11_9FUNG|nr:Ubiquitin carboxyl-terminal hydrolase 36 [Linnemannia gamsii]
MVSVTVDSQLLKKSNSAFHARRIQFKESTRLDLKQERLKKKYRPVNAPSANSTDGPAKFAPSALVPYSGNASSSTSTATEDRNGFRLPSTILFSKEKVQVAWPQPRPIGPGLNNLGNTCFLNSVLQCLTYTAPLTNYLLSGHHSNSCKTTNFCMMCLLENHVGRCFSRSMTESISPKVIVGRLRNIAKQFRIGRQEDSHEFARYLVDALQRSCLIGHDSKLDDRIKETTVVHQIFGGYFQSQVKCMRCGHESNTFETYLDVSLDIKGADSVQKAFRDYTTPEILSKGNQYKCEKCKILVDAKKQMTIYDAPNILSVHLKRFTFTGQKINRHVRFEPTLSLTPYMSKNKDHGDLNYSLYAVLVHAGGSCHSGHYYCYVKGSNGIWYSMNDSHVGVVSLQSVLSQNAYMLFYTLNKKGTSKSPSTNGAKPNGTANGVKVNGIMNGTKAMSTQIKRPRLDGDEVGAKVDRSALAHKEKRSKVDINGVKVNGAANGIKVTPNVAKRSLLDDGDDEADVKKRIKMDESASPANILEMSKAERHRLKKEKKKARKLEKMNGSNATASLNDYELATSAPSPSTAHVPAKAIFGVPVPNIASKNMSPLADLDLIPAPKAVVKPTPITIPTARHNDWRVTQGAMKSPTADDRKLMLIEHKPKAEYKDREDEQDAESVKEDAEQDGWTVKSKPTTQVIVVAHNEASTSKREKLQALIERESEFKSAEVKEAILGEQKHMLGSKVSTWEEPSYAMTKAREDVLRTLKPKHHRPDAYDVDYDRGKVKKVKTKNVMDGPAVGAKVGNKFQKEQDVRNLVKPKFNKNKKNGGKKVANEL